MTVYAMHRHSRSTETTSPLEAFPSVERASVALQLRARKQESGTYYAHEDNTATPRPMVAFPEADLTGFMLVWRRRAGEDRPGPGDAPDEVWRLTPNGGVLKEAYRDGKDYALPALTPEERRAKALHAVGTLPLLTDEYLADCDPTWRRVLRDLVQDDEVELAIHRVMQVAWQQEREARAR
jgi:hypothetical protein